MIKENWKGAGFVVLHGVAMDNSVRTTFCKDEAEIELEIERINSYEHIGAYVVSVFAVGNYYVPTN